ncbi:MAG: phenylalanine--tRNA ligase subunit alpha, partial [Planctomycetota bacterium]
MLDQLEELESQGLAQLSEVSDPDALESWRIEYLGTKGKLKAAASGLKDVSKEEKPAVGKKLNEVKKALESSFKDRKQTVASGGAAKGPALDVTLPGLDLPIGRRHIISRVIEELIEVFSRMGFESVTGPELEDDEHNFIDLNIPEDHPARDPIDNFYIDEKHPTDRPRMLRSQTSTVQIRTLETRKPPLKIIAPGRVYRPDTVDATHSFMFHQLEGLYVDKNVTMAHLKTTLYQFARAYFGDDAEIRLVPSYFPFTEPSAEFYMKIRLREDKPPQWVELG